MQTAGAAEEGLLEKCKNDAPAFHPRCRRLVPGNPDGGEEPRTRMLSQCPGKSQAGLEGSRARINN